MPNYDDHDEVINLLRKAQEADTDQRNKAREVHVFLDKPDGQWEPEILQAYDDAGIPRFTFDQCNDIVDDIAGELEQSEFGIKVRPAGGQASEDVAEVYDGLIRNIQSVSYADDVYDQSGRNMISAGFDAWRVNQRYGDGDSFDQELFIDKIPNALDSVWMDPSCYEAAPRTAKYAFVLEGKSRADYFKKWPDGGGQSVTTDAVAEIYSHKPEVIVVGEILYREKMEREIVEMTNGAIYVVEDDFKKVEKELRQANIVVAKDGQGNERRRKRNIWMVKSRLFDGSGWLTDPQDTVFQYIPIVPVYGNFKVYENKVTYWGAVTKKLDPQRVYNYAESKKVSDGVLQPRPKIFATPEQIAGYEDDWSNINTSTKATQLYRHQDNVPPPYQGGGPQADPTLEIVSNDALTNLQSSRLQQPNQPVGLRSGVAVELEQNKEDTKNYKYFKAMEVAMTYTGLVLVDAIPRVYDARRQVRILGEDGKTSTVTINDMVLDQDTNTMVEMNNLGHGNYDVVCDVGPMFANRQQETVAAFNEVAGIDPTIIQNGKDIWLSNINAPGMSEMADRARAELLAAGAIPEDQWTDEEREQAAQAQAAAAENPPPPDPLLLAAQAQVQSARNEELKIQQDGQLKSAQLQLDREKLQLEALKVQGQQEQAEIKAIMDANKQSNDNLASQIDGLKKLIEAFGIQVLGGTAPEQLIAQQGANVSQTQKEELQ